MKKANYFITNEAVKYWKKEIKNAKNGRLQVAKSNGKIYIVNSYNAFVIPDCETIFSDLVQPATLRPSPDDGRAHIWRNGGFHEESASNTVNIVEAILNAETTHATRTALCIDSSYNGKQLRIYKICNDELVGIDCKYDAMVNHNFTHTLTMKSRTAPAVFRHADFVTIILPVHSPYLNDKIRAILPNQK